MIKHRSKGITLIELLVALSIFVVIGGILTSIFISGWKTFDRESAQTNTQDQIKFVTSRITQDSQEATRVIDTRTFDEEVYYSYPKSLILELKSIDANKNPIEDLFDYEVFYVDPLNSKKLKVTIEADPTSSRRSETKTISDIIESVDFEYFVIDGSSIQFPENGNGEFILPVAQTIDTQRINVTATTAQESFGKTIRTTLTGSAKIRNL